MAQSKSLKYVILFSLLFVGAVVLGDVIGNIKIQTNTISSTNTNGDITFDPNGTGKIIAVGNIHLPTQGDLRFEDSAGGEYVAIQAPATVGSNLTFTLPSADGSNNQVLKTNGSGVLSFTDNGITAIGAVGSSANANGMTLTSGTLNLEPASASHPGVVTTGTQVFAGSKQFPALMGIGRAPNTGTLAVQANGTNYDSALSLYSSGGTYKHQWYPETNGYFYIKPDALTIFPFMYDNAGKVGIGNGSPEAQLTVGVAADVVQLSVKSNGTQTSNLIQTKDTGGTIVTKTTASGDQHAQRVMAGTTSNFTNSSVGLELQSTSKAFLPSRMTAAQRDALTAVDGMELYNSDSARKEVRQNGAWGGPGENSSINILLEPVNYNANAELGTTTSWSETGGGTLAVTSTAANVGFGKFSISYDASANTDYVSTTAVTVPSGLFGNNCLAEFYYKGFDTNMTASVSDGTNTLISQALTAASTFTKVQMNFVCPSSGTLELRVTASADAAIGYIDQAYIGSASNISNVSQAEFYGSIKVTGCNATFSRTNTSYGDHTSSPASCSYSASGNASSPSSTLMGIRFTNLAPGDYWLEYEGGAERTNATDTNGCFFRFTDGTNTADAENYLGTGATGTIRVPKVGGRIQRTSGGDTTFKIQLKSEGANATCALYGSTTIPGTIRVYKFPLSSQTAVTTDQSDFGWTSDNAIVTTNGFGTLAASSFFKKRIGDTLYVRGWFTAGTVAASTAYLQLASGLTIDTTKISTAANKTLVGYAHQLRTAAGPTTTELDTLHFDGSTTNQVFFSYQTGSNVFTKVNGNAIYSSGDTVSFEFNVPITGWVNTSRAMQIVNSVVNTSSGVTRVEAANINCDGGSAITSQLGTWVSSVGNISSGACAITLTTGVFGSTPYCTANPNGTFASAGIMLDVRATSATAVSVDCENDASAECSSYDFNIICVGAK